ncbi:MAG: hypothetical protein AB7L66_04665 [Gemmatimonadales bacterium]
MRSLPVSLALVSVLVVPMAAQAKPTTPVQAKPPVVAQKPDTQHRTAPATATATPPASTMHPTSKPVAAPKAGTASEGAKSKARKHTPKKVRKDSTAAKVSNR